MLTRPQAFDCDHVLSSSTAFAHPGHDVSGLAAG